MSIRKFTFFAIGFMMLCVVVSTVRSMTATATPQADAAAAAVGPQEDRGDGESDTQSSVVIAAAVGPSATASATVTQTPNVEITMLFLGATDTAVAVAKTEAEQHAQRETQAAQDLALAFGLTSQAQQTAEAGHATATMAATQTQAAIAAGHATETMAATQTQYAGTAWADVTATQLAATQEIEQNALLAKKVSLWGGVLLLFCVAALGVSFLGVRVYHSWKISKAEYIQTSAIMPDAQGRFPLPNTDALGRDTKVINPNLAHRAVIDPDKDDLTADQALKNTQDLRKLEATRAIAQSPALLRQALRTSKPTVTAVTPGLPDANMQISRPPVGLLGDSERPLTTPAWSAMENWDGQGPIPYGVSTRGLERVGLQQVPHGGIFGMTGKGKSRYFLRPFIAGAIAAGQRVVILGKQADFWPFAAHPNVKMIPIRHITEIEEATRYAEYLKRIVMEMNRRDDYLTAHQVSTWDRAGRENTLIVLDELGNALDMMPRDVAQEAYRWVSGLVREGRKAGFNVWLASQRAVGFKSIVEQLGRAVFYLSDADASRYALGMPGAETLSDGHFFAKFQGVRQCAAFDPTDDELVSFLRNRSVPVHEPIEWIEGTTTDVAPAPVVDEETAIENRIRLVLARMKAEGTVSLSGVQREVFGDDDPRGGKHFKKIQQTWIEMQAESATATQDKPVTGDMPGSDTGIPLGSAA